LSWVRTLGMQSNWGLIVLVDHLAEHGGIRALQQGADICLTRPVTPALIAASVYSPGRRLFLRRQAMSTANPIENVCRTAPAAENQQADALGPSRGAQHGISVCASSWAWRRPEVAALPFAVMRRSHGSLSAQPRAPAQSGAPVQ